MDVLGLLKEVSGLGIDSVIVGAVILLVVRNWLSETRREISKEIDDKVGSAKTDLEALMQENRQEIASFKTETRQEFDAARTETAAGPWRSLTQEFFGAVDQRKSARI